MPLSTSGPDHKDLSGLAHVLLTFGSKIAPTATLKLQSVRLRRERTWAENLNGLHTFCLHPLLPIEKVAMQKNQGHSKTFFWPLTIKSLLGVFVDYANKLAFVFALLIVISLPCLRIAPSSLVKFSLGLRQVGR